MKKLLLLALLASPMMRAMEKPQELKEEAKSDVVQVLAMLQKERKELEEKHEAAEKWAIQEPGKDNRKLSKAKAKQLAKDIAAKKKQEDALIKKLAK